MSDVIRRLLDEERLEEVRPDAAAALALLEEARRHLDSAERIGDLDPNGAYQLVYDGVRKAIAAHMAATGYRATSRPGAHVAVGEFASVSLLSTEDVARFERVRRNRNRSEYAVAHFTRKVVADELVWARRIVGLLGERLR
ncbi:MAG: hypothetical protein WD249_07545 [Gaiellaceae bacterium]